MLQKDQEKNKRISKEVKGRVRVIEKFLRDKYAKLFLYQQKLGLLIP